jgi:hypothetical protein
MLAAASVADNVNVCRKLKLILPTYFSAEKTNVAVNNYYKAVIMETNFLKLLVENVPFKKEANKDG